MILARRTPILALHADTGHAPPVLVRDAGLGYAGGAGGADALPYPDGARAFHLLDLVCDPLCVHRLQDVGRGAGQERKDGKSTIFLVLLEPTPKTIESRQELAGEYFSAQGVPGMVGYLQRGERGRE